MPFFQNLISKYGNECINKLSQYFTYFAIPPFDILMNFEEKRDKIYILISG